MCLRIFVIFFKDYLQLFVPAAVDCYIAKVIQKCFCHVLVDLWDVFKCPISRCYFKFETLVYKILSLFLGDFFHILGRCGFIWVLLLQLFYSLIPSYSLYLLEIYSVSYFYSIYFKVKQKDRPGDVFLLKTDISCVWTTFAQIANLH